MVRHYYVLAAGVAIFYCTQLTANTYALRITTTQVQSIALASAPWIITTGTVCGCLYFLKQHMHHQQELLRIMRERVPHPKQTQESSPVREVSVARALLNDDHEARIAELENIVRSLIKPKHKQPPEAPPRRTSPLSTTLKGRTGSPSTTVRGRLGIQGASTPPSPLQEAPGHASSQLSLMRQPAEEPATQTGESSGNSSSPSPPLEFGGALNQSASTSSLALPYQEGESFGIAAHAVAAVHDAEGPKGKPA